MESQTVYFTGIMVFILISQMYHRISVLRPVFICAIVPEYEYKNKYYYFGTHKYKYEYQKFSTRVQPVRVPQPCK